nr:hypothetical protein [Tanacetum cinerariifolium]
SLKKYSFDSSDIVDTFMVEKSKLGEDKKGKVIDPSHYRAFADVDHVGCQDTCRSTSGSLQFMGDRLIKYQLADIFTKALGRERIKFLINKLGMRCFMSETLKQLADEVEE